MDTMPHRQITDMQGEMSLPRQNGELVFATPWEARAFGLAVALQESGVYEWREFSSALAAEIARAEQAGNTSIYYERWLLSLEQLLMANGLVTPAEISDRMASHAAHDDHTGHDHEL
jgi:nitrile hydratase accessory protein